MHPDQIPRFQHRIIHQPDEGEENGLAGRGFDDGGFADAGGVQVDVGAFFGGVFVDGEVEEFDDVADEVGQLAGMGR